MKFLQTLHQFRKGIRLHSFVLAVLMTWAMLCSIVVFGRIQYYSADLDAVSGTDTENTYLLLGSPLKEESLSAAETTLMADPLVKAVYSIQAVELLFYEGRPVEVYLYQPEMVEAFPKLKDLGIDFSADPNGCILGKLFHSGNEITLTSEKGEAVFPVAGRLTSPYRYLALTECYSDYGNFPNGPALGDLFRDTPAILLPQTREVMEKISALEPITRTPANLLVTFHSGSSTEAQEALLDGTNLASNYIFPLAELTDAALAQRSETLKLELPQPLLLAVTSMVAYLSMTVLILQKKQPALAQMYLCGASRRRCGAVVFTAIQLICLFPVICSTAFILIWPRLYWPALHPLNVAVNGHFTQWLYNQPGLVSLWSSLYRFLGSTVTIRPSCLLVVLGYWLLTAAISLALTIGFMKKHTPLTYLKGATQ